MESSCCIQPVSFLLFNKRTIRRILTRKWGFTGDVPDGKAENVVVALLGKRSRLYFVASDARESLVMESKLRNMGVLTIRRTKQFLKMLGFADKVPDAQSHYFEVVLAFEPSLYFVASDASKSLVMESKLKQLKENFGIKSERR